MQREVGKNKMIAIISEYASQGSGSDMRELFKMLEEAGIALDACTFYDAAPQPPPRGPNGMPDTDLWFVTKTEAKRAGYALLNGSYPMPEVLSWRQTLIDALLAAPPRLIITLGSLPLWMLAGKDSAPKWRGSILSFANIKLIPTYSPKDILRNWAWRYIAMADLRRAKQESAFPEIKIPAYDFLIRPTLGQVEGVLETLWFRAQKALLEGGKFKLSVDIETRKRHIACIGLAWSNTEALCIPLMCVENLRGYWTEEEEYKVISLLTRLLQHPAVAVVGQNFSYDNQYLAKHWGLLVRCADDTMVAQHVCFPSMPKGLDFISSMYCPYHVYWKEEGKLWDPESMPEEQYWEYNCKDAVITYEAMETLHRIIDHQKLREQYEFLMSVREGPLMRMMLRGVNIDKKARSAMAGQLLEAIAEREAWFHSIIPDFDSKKSKIPWFRSPHQMMRLFYEEMGLPKQLKRATKRPSVDDECLKKLTSKEPLLIPLVEKILEYRSLGVFFSTFVQAPLGDDGRMRCSYNVAGPETFRLSSSEDAFGDGTNLQNLPKGNEK